ncbi:ParB/RepB/Spo0J family partition protein [Paraburkholderia megapolitana]|uniref:ParB/RepB/Spo0J family partition protein n=1 Tax=Paraburkholderia megapolitana TaxID=420953 RepID=UPI0038B8F061
MGKAVVNKDKKASGSLNLAAGLMRGLAQENAALETRQHDALNVATPAPAPANVVESPSSSVTGFDAPQRVLVKDCIPNPYNPRIFYSDTNLHELALTLKREGQIEPIKVTRLPAFPGKLVVIDGQRRLRATSINGDEYINAAFREDQTPEQLYTIAYRANHDHERQTIFDDAIAWKRLLEEKIFPDQNALAEKVGRDKATISKTIGLNVLPNTLLERMAESSDTVGLQAAYFIKLIFERSGEELADKMLSSVIDRKKSVRDLENFVRTHSDGKPRKSSRTRYNVRHDFTANEASVGQLKTYPDGRVDLQLTGVSVEQQDALAEKLKRVVDDYVTELVTAAR